MRPAGPDHGHTFRANSALTATIARDANLAMDALPDGLIEVGKDPDPALSEEPPSEAVPTRALTAAAQETKFNSFKQVQLLCGGNGCGYVKATLSVTAGRGAPGAGWGNQAQIELNPITFGSGWSVTPGTTRPSRFCLQVILQMKATAAFATTAPFGAIPMAFDGGNDPVVSGTVATYFGLKCRTPTTQAGNVAVLNPNGTLWTGGRAKIRSVTIWVRGIAYWGRAYVASPWAADAIAFG